MEELPSSSSSTSSNQSQSLPNKRRCSNQDDSSGIGNPPPPAAAPSPKQKNQMMACPYCHGEAQVPSRKRRTKKQKRAYQYAKENGLPLLPSPPIQKEPCKECDGCGILPQLSVNTDQQPRVKTDVHIGIVGGGIGGLALALACQHRNIPYTVYERDMSFDQRSQGYGLTMQQGGKALQALGLATTGDNRLGIHSKRHIVHLPDGTQVGQWGLKVWGRPESKKEDAKRQNAHIARQELRRILYEQILDRDNIKWGHKLLGYEEEMGSVTMEFDVVNDSEGSTTTSSEVVRQQASVLVGADGIRSAVRRNKIGDELSPFRYLGCIVILGIAPSPDSSSLTSDNETVFQTADGETRLYAMPFSKKGHETADAAHFVGDAMGNKGETMWQLSFPLSEDEAKDLSKGGPGSLKVEAIKRCGSWHTPIPDLLRNTPEELISGYPVYDREILEGNCFRCGSDESDSKNSKVTLLGDAAHPMSPFKGQGANQALLDAVLLARALYRVYRYQGDEEKLKISKVDTLEDELMEYEMIMLKRSKGKVKASADAAKFLHTKAAISEGNVTRGAAATALQPVKNTNPK